MVRKIFPHSIVPQAERDKVYRPDSSGTSPVRVELKSPRTDVRKRFVTGREISSGELSLIEEAFDTNLLRTLAKKSVQTDKRSDKVACGRVVEEAQITAQLDHPHIVPVHELLIDKDDRLCFTMKMVQGTTLSDLLHQKSCADTTEKDLFFQLQVLLKVCDAVSFAHSRGVIHRDLKPENIMVGSFGQVYLMDWGIALLTDGKRPAPKRQPTPMDESRDHYGLLNEHGVINATIKYMAPEQAHGDIRMLGEHTDVFGLGVILYEILTHRPPYTQELLNDAIHAALEGRFPPPERVVDHDLPPRLCGIVRKAMAVDPADRYPTAADLKNDIEGFLQSGWQFERRIFPAGSVIVREEEPGNEAFVITAGRCRVTKMVDGHPKLLEEMGVGDVFGEIAVFTRRHRTATVEAIEPVTVKVITQANFEEDLGMNFWLGLFAKALGERLLEADEKIFELERRLKQISDLCGK